MSGSRPCTISSCLVSKAQTGNSAALDELLTQLTPIITSYCKARLSSYAGGRDTAEDVAQETLLTVYRALGDYVDRGLPFTAWVYAIAARKVADAQRGVLKAPTPVAEVPEAADAGPSPEDRLLTAARDDELRTLLDNLPERTRTVLMLRAEGLSAERAGEYVGLSAGSARVTYHRGVARLRELARGA